MNETNHSLVTEFVLLGLSSSQELQPSCFLFSLLCLAITTGKLSHHPHCNLRFLPSYPMCFCSANLSLIDICVASFATPKWLQTFWLSTRVFLLVCLPLGFLCSSICWWWNGAPCIHGLWPLHCYMQTSPLLYHNHELCVCVTLSSFHDAGLIHTTSQLAFTVNLLFVGLIKWIVFSRLPFSDQTGLRRHLCYQFTNSCRQWPSFLWVPSSLLVLLPTLWYSSQLGTTSLCQHGQGPLHIDCSYLLWCCYSLDHASSSMCGPSAVIQLDKVLAVFYTIFTSILNPVIYTLRNKEMKAAMSKLKSHIWSLAGFLQS